MKLCNKLIFSILASLALFGCSKDEVSGPEYLEVNKNMNACWNGRTDRRIRHCN